MQPGNPSKSIATAVVTYAILLGGMVRWHVSYGPPYHQATPPLLAVFALCAALMGLLSIWAASSAIHWAAGASAVLVGGALLIGLWLMFYDWNRHLIWQMVIIVLTQMAFLVLLFGLARLCGWAVALHGTAAADRFAKTKFSVRDLLILTSAFAVFFGVLGAVRPVSFSEQMLVILAAGGLCAALVTAAGYWIRFSRSPLGPRIAVGLLAAPLGGVVYVTAASYTSLLFSWRWYAAVTCLQLVLVLIPLLFVRLPGPAIGTPESPNGRRE